MEREFFDSLGNFFCGEGVGITRGKMMSSDALKWQGKVFAFFSRKKKLVVKLGKSFDPRSVPIPIKVFNPFKKRGPLNGWFELSFDYQQEWESFIRLALERLKAEYSLQS